MDLRYCAECGNEYDALAGQCPFCSEGQPALPVGARTIGQGSTPNRDIIEPRNQEESKMKNEVARAQYWFYCDQKAKLGDDAKRLNDEAKKAAMLADAANKKLAVAEKQLSTAEKILVSVSRVDSGRPAEAD